MPRKRTRPTEERTTGREELKPLAPMTPQEALQRVQRLHREGKLPKVSEVFAKLGESLNKPGSKEKQPRLKPWPPKS